MSSEITAMLENFNTNRKFCHQTIMDVITNYIYREKRYDIHFSIALIYSKNALNIHAKELRKSLRKTDQLICITESMVCVVFDATKAHTYVKAAENLYKALKSIEYHQHYYIATAFSNDFNENYLDMLNHLFDRLYYALEHNCYSNVNYEDYFI